MTRIISAATTSQAVWNEGLGPHAAALSPATNFAQDRDVSTVERVGSRPSLPASDSLEALRAYQYEVQENSLGRFADERGRMRSRTMAMYETSCAVADGRLPLGRFRTTPDPDYCLPGLRGRLFGMVGWQDWGDRSRERPPLFPTLLRTIAEREKRPARYLDCFCGHGVALREALQSPISRGHVEAIGADLFDWNTLRPDVKAYFDEAQPGLFDATPHLLLGDATRLQVEAPVDLITVVEGLQYAPDKLFAICNWYNALADNGVLVIASESDSGTGSLVCTQGAILAREHHAMADFVRTLAQAGIDFALARGSPEGRADETSGLLIVKSPGTRLGLLRPAIETFERPDHYLISYYPRDPRLVAVSRT